MNKPVEEATWEEELIFESKFPTFNLEDKTGLDEGDSDKEGTKTGLEVETVVETQAWLTHLACVF